MNKHSKTLRYLGNCQICKSDFTRDRIDVIKQKTDFSLFHITCKSCLTSALVALITDKKFDKDKNRKKKIITAIGSLTDLTKDDLPDLCFNKLLRKKDIGLIISYYKK